MYINCTVCVGLGSINIGDVEDGVIQECPGCDGSGLSEDVDTTSDEEAVDMHVA